jgi:hypothetical protein
MYAIVRLNTFDEMKLTAAAGQLAEFDALHSSKLIGTGRVTTTDLATGAR